MTPAPTRLHVLLASESDFALVLRRGPARQVAAIGWNRRKDSFQLGQWLDARIDNARCDLSPDGRHFLYLASKYDPKESDRRIVSYTVMSRAPYFTAIHYWGPKSWTSGGVFLNNTRFQLYNSSPLAEARTLPRFAHLKDTPQWQKDFSLDDIATYRRKRDGWALLPDDFQRRHLWSRWHGEWTLSLSIDLEKGREPRKPDFYELKHQEKSVIDSSEWTWADLDKPRKRLCFTIGGQLWSLDLKTESHPVLLHDFSAMKFEPLTAPY